MHSSGIARNYKANIEFESFFDQTDKRLRHLKGGINKNGFFSRESSVYDGDNHRREVKVSAPKIPQKEPLSTIFLRKFFPSTRTQNFNCDARTEEEKSRYKMGRKSTYEFKNNIPGNKNKKSVKTNTEQSKYFDEIWEMVSNPGTKDNLVLQGMLASTVAKIKAQVDALLESEKYILECLGKYLNDDELIFQSLVNALLQHGTLLKNTQETNMVMQIEVFQEYVHMLRNQNEHFQKEITTMTKQMAALRDDLMTAHGDDECKTTKTSSLSDVKKNNDYLRRKIKVLREEAISLQAVLFDLRTEVFDLQAKNIELEIGFDDLKVWSERTVFDCSTQVSYQAHTLKNNAVAWEMLNNSSKILFEEIDSLKRKLDNKKYTTNWNMTECLTENNVNPQDLMELCRECIRDLGCRLLTKDEVNSSVEMKKRSSVIENLLPNVKTFMSNDLELQHLELMRLELKEYELKESEWQDEHKKLLDEKQHILQSRKQLSDNYQQLYEENQSLKEGILPQDQPVLVGSKMQLRKVLGMIPKRSQDHIDAEGQSRVKDLEDTLNDMACENNRLTMVAVYNQRVGEQLHSTIEDHYDLIHSLQNSVEELTNKQKLDYEEKRVLCKEIQEIFAEKSKLLLIVKDLQHRTEKNTINKQSFEKLTNELKFVQQDKESVLEENRSLAMEVQDLLKKRQQDKIHTQHAGSMCQKLSEQLKQTEKEIQVIKTEYEKDAMTSKHQINEYKSEMANVQMKLQGFQEKFRQLQDQLNESKKGKKELQDLLAAQTRLVEEGTQKYAKTAKKKQETSLEFEKCKHELSAVIADREELLKKYENSEKTWVKKLTDANSRIARQLAEIDKMTTETLQKSDIINELIPRSNELDTVRLELSELKEKHNNLQMAAKKAQEDGYSWQLQAKNLQLDLKEIKFTKAELEIQHDKILISCANFESKCESQEQELKQAINDRKELLEKISILNDVQIKYEKQDIKLRQEISIRDELIKEINKKMEEDAAQYLLDMQQVNQSQQQVQLTLKNTEECLVRLQEKHKYLGERIVHCIKMLVDEKLTREDSQRIQKETMKRITILECEKDGMEDHVSIMLKDLENIRGQNKILMMKEESYIGQLKNEENAHKILKERLPRLIHEAEVANQRVAFLESQLTDLANENIMLKRHEMEQKLNYDNRIKERVKHLKDEINFAREEILRLRKTIAENEQEILKLNFSLRELNIRLKDNAVPSPRAKPHTYGANRSQ